MTRYKCTYRSDAVTTLIHTHRSEEIAVVGSFSVISFDPAVTLGYSDRPPLIGVSPSDGVGAG